MVGKCWAYSRVEGMGNSTGWLEEADVWTGAGQADPAPAASVGGAAGGGWAIGDATAALSGHG